MLDKIKAWHIILVMIFMIGGAVYKFDVCKASKESVEDLAGDYQNYKLENYRKHIQQRVWDLQRRFPNTYQQMPEYLHLKEELRKVDLKIQAYYNRGKG